MILTKYSVDRNRKIKDKKKLLKKLYKSRQQQHISYIYAVRKLEGRELTLFDKFKVNLIVKFGISTFDLIALILALISIALNVCDLLGKFT